jgi:hypothetical protein
VLVRDTLDDRNVDIRGLCELSSRFCFPLPLPRCSQMCHRQREGSIHRVGALMSTQLRFEVRGGSTRGGCICLAMITMEQLPFQLCRPQFSE